MGVWGNRGWQIGLWSCLLVAFSPVLLDLAIHLRENVWARTALIFPWLVWVAVWNSADGGGGEPSAAGHREDHRSVWLWLLLGLAIELLAIAGGALRFGRLGLLIAVMGLCHGFGWARLPTVLLLVWALPLPSFLVEGLGHPGLQALPATAIAATIPGLGCEGLDHGPIWKTECHQFVLPAADNLIAMAYGLAGLGWFRGLSRGAGPLEALLGAGRWMLLAIPLHLSFMLIAAMTFRLTDDAGWTRLLLSESSWIVIVCLGFALSLGVSRGLTLGGRPLEPTG